MPTTKQPTERKRWEAKAKEQMAAIAKMKKAEIAYKEAEKAFLGL